MAVRLRGRFADGIPAVGKSIRRLVVGSDGDDGEGNGGTEGRTASGSAKSTRSSGRGSSGNT